MDTRTLTLTVAELDTLRFLLGVVDNDFESAEDRAAFESLYDKAWL